MKKNSSSDLENDILPSRWKRRERKAKKRMPLHGRGMKDLAKRLTDKYSTPRHAR